MPRERATSTRTDLLFIADSDGSVGFGHVRRCHALGSELKTAGVRSAFLIRGDGVGAEWLRAQGEIVSTIAEEDDPTLLAREVTRAGARLLALDVAQPVGQRFVMTLRRSCAVVMIDNEGPGRFEADLSVSPRTVPGQEWRAAVGQHVGSPAYAILGERFRPWPRRPGERRRVLVTMGATDPDGLTLLAVRALDRVHGSIQRIVVVGPGFRPRDELRRVLAETKHPFEVHHNVPEMTSLVATADVAIAAVGLSAYELAAAGVPTVLVPRCPRDRAQAEAFELAGASAIADRTEESIAAKLRPLVAGSGVRRQLSLAAEQFVDGRGTERVAELVRDVLRGTRSRRGRRRCGPSGSGR